MRNTDAVAPILFDVIREIERIQKANALCIKSVRDAMKRRNVSVPEVSPAHGIARGRINNQDAGMTPAARTTEGDIDGQKEG